MKLKDLTTIIPALVLVAGVAVLALSVSTGAAPVPAQSGRTGQLHIVKDCNLYNFLPGGHCTIVTSNLAAIPASVVHYSQAFGIPMTQRTKFQNQELEYEDR